MCGLRTRPRTDVDPRRVRAIPCPVHYWEAPRRLSAVVTMLSHRRRARLLSNSSSSSGGGGGGGGTAGSLMYSTCRRQSVSYRPVFRMHIQSARSTLTSSNHSSPIHPSLPHAPSTKSATFAPHVVQLWSKLPEEVVSASSASAFISRLNSMHVSFFNVLF